MKTKKTKSMKFEEHFANFLLKLVIISFILMVIAWFLSFVIPVIIPFAILLTIFTIFIYPVVKIKEWLKGRGK